MYRDRRGVGVHRSASSAGLRRSSGTGRARSANLHRLHVRGRWIDQAARARWRPCGTKLCWATGSSCMAAAAMSLGAPRATGVNVLHRRRSVRYPYPRSAAGPDGTGRRTRRRRSDSTRRDRSSDKQFLTAFDCKYIILPTCETPRGPTQNGVVRVLRARTPNSARLLSMCNDVCLSAVCCPSLELAPFTREFGWRRRRRLSFRGVQFILVRINERSSTAAALIVLAARKVLVLRIISCNIMQMSCLMLPAACTST